MTEKSKHVDYEMKYIGWNIGATRIERHETKGDIEILELKIDGVDVLKQLEKAEKYDGEHKAAMIVEEELRKIDDKLEAVKKELEPILKESKEYLDTHDKPEPPNREVSRYWLEKGFYGTALEIQKILEAEG